MENIRLYLQSCYNELIHHVEWPTWEQLVESTYMVIIASVIISLILMIYDAISNQLLQFIYNIL